MNFWERRRMRKTAVEMLRHSVYVRNVREDVAAAAALERLAAPPAAGVGLVLTTDEALRQLNRTYRGQDQATDVLSFAMDPGDQEPGEPPYLGDILVSVPRAAAGASLAGHPLADELGLLAVHGLLHLLGHEDDTAAGAAAMYRLEIELGVRRPDDVPDDLTS